ncbi:MAG TPA: hypothetical protein VIY48_02380 [Candidatus Paceibacterota bacterium]
MGSWMTSDGMYYEGDQSNSDMAVPRRPAPYYHWNTTTQQWEFNIADFRSQAKDQIDAWFIVGEPRITNVYASFVDDAALNAILETFHTNLIAAVDTATPEDIITWVYNLQWPQPAI